jgi:NDP-sugar pyrophosphorylase family protein
MKAVIIAGGEGKRLRPLTYEMPKPLIPVQGKAAIEYLVDNFIAYGCEKVIIVVRAKDEHFFRNWGLVYLHKNKDVDPKRLHMVIETIPVGTLGAIAKAVKGNIEEGESFFATNADELKDIDLQELENVHNTAKVSRPGTLGTIVVKEMVEKETFGNVSYHNNVVTEFHEKKDVPGAVFASLGLYVLNAMSVLQFYSEHQSQTGDSFAMVENHLFPQLAQLGKLAGYEHKGQFYPTDDFQKWEKAILEYKHENPRYPKNS